MPKKITIKEFKERANKIHNGKYGYDDTVYVNSYTKVIIKCPIHGNFEQTPSTHLRGHGCPKCRDEENGKRQSLTTEEFKERANKIHNGKYGYDDSVYINGCAKVTIKCPIHGKFEQEAHSHLRGCGCPKCATERNTLKLTKTTEEFKKEANIVHKGKYGYDDAVYVNNKSRVIIKCPIHGKFEQEAGMHIRGAGCPECGKERIKLKQSLTTEEFIERANKVHDGKYGYDDTVYVNTRSKVTIKCPIHGNFKQLAHCHLQGHGCPKCNSSKLENDIKRLLIKSKIKFEEQKPFSWLVGPNGGPQTLDFYLPDLGIGIECQGGQHFYAIDIFGGEKSFKYTQECDQNKLKLCEEHGIKLIYYSNLSTPDKPFDYPYPVYEDGAKLVEKLMSRKEELDKGEGEE